MAAFLVAHRVALTDSLVDTVPDDASARPPSDTAPPSPQSPPTGAGPPPSAAAPAPARWGGPLPPGRDAAYSISAADLDTLLEALEEEAATRSSHATKVPLPATKLDGIVPIVAFEFPDLGTPQRQALSGVTEVPVSAADAERYAAVPKFVRTQSVPSSLTAP